MAILNIQKISKSYKKRQIIKNISFYIHSQEIIGLLGPNGSGKTTTFYIILGIVQHDSGNILLNNQDIGKLPIYSRARLGISYLPQENSIFRKLTVFNNLMAIAQMQQYPSSIDRYKHIQQLMKDFDIQHLKNNKGYTLSGGERKRVEIARSLISNPKFILLDEPFSGVDPISINNIQNIIKQLKNYKLGILITDHNVKATLSICDRAYIINQGTFIAHGSINKIMCNTNVQKIYLGNSFLNNCINKKTQTQDAK